MRQISSFIYREKDDPNKFVFRQDQEFPVNPESNKKDGFRLRSVRSVASTPKFEIREDRIQVDGFEAFTGDPQNPSGYVQFIHRSIRRLSRDKQVKGRISSYSYEFKDGSQLTNSSTVSLKNFKKSSATNNTGGFASIQSTGKYQ